MRTAPAAFALMALAALTAPALAKNSNAQKGEDKSVPSSCSAYQEAEDGSWTQLPCKETGERDQTQTQHRTPAPGAEQETR